MRKIRVLVVAADEAQRASETAVLSGLEGVEVVGATDSARAAIRVIRRRRPELIVMDLLMPRMSGLEAAALIKRGPAAPRVVLVSVGDGPAHALAMREFRIDDVVRNERLAAALPDLLRRYFPERWPGESERPGN